MNFVIIVLAILAQHVSKTSGAHNIVPHGYIRFFYQDHAIGKLGADTALLLWLLIPLLFAASIHLYLLNYYVGWLVLAILFALLTFFTLGYSNCRNALDQLGNTDIQADYNGLVPNLAADASHTEKHSLATLVTLRYVMVPIFWIFTLGAYGAIIILLLYTFNRCFPRNPTAMHIIQVFEWLPARFLALSYTLDCCFEQSWLACKQFATRATSEELTNNFIVPQVLSRTNLKRNNPQLLFARQLVIWLATMAIITLFVTFS